MDSFLFLLIVMYATRFYGYVAQHQLNQLKIAALAARLRCSFTDMLKEGSNKRYFKWI